MPASAIQPAPTPVRGSCSAWEACAAGRGRRRGGRRRLGRGGLRGSGLRRGRRGRRRRLRLGLLVAERVLVLLVPGTLREGGGRDREGAQQRRDDEQGAGHRARQCIPRYRPRPMEEGRHILVLTDRDWTHPQGGGTGTNLYGQVSRWVAWGHRVTVVAGDYPGAVAREELGPDLTVHRMGTRLTVFPRAAWACLRRGLARDADVVLEVVNGITFLTPLWLRRPRVALVHHIHRDHYVAEMGRPGAVAALLAETLPLRLLYRDTTFLTISEAGRHDLTELGLPEDRIHVAYLGVEPPPFPATERSQAPRLLYLGRLKQYKRVEILLDVLEAVPEAVLDIAGDGDHREALEADIAARGLGDRVVLHGHVSEEEKAALLSRSWVNLTASSAEGWCLTVMEAAMYRTPSAALAVGGLPESIEDGRTGLLADDGAGLIEHVRALVDRPWRCASASARRALDRASGFTWERTARENLAVLEAEADAERAGLRASMRGSETLKAAGLAAATLASNAIALMFTVAVRAAAGRRRLRLAGRADLDLPDPRGARLGAAGRRGAGGRHRHARLGHPAGVHARRVAAGAAARVRRRGRVLRAAARADRLPAVGRAELGGRRDAPHGLPVAAALDRARRAAGRARLPGGRLVDRARGRRAADLRPGAGRRRAGRDRRLPRHSGVDGGHRRRARS